MLRQLAVLGLLFTLMAPVLAGEYVPVTQFDPNRNAAQDIEDAIQEAQRTNKRILLDVGGTWCIWCKVMDKFFEEHTNLVTLRDQNYLMVKINYSPLRRNEVVLARYPKVTGYPHLFVLDSAGTLLHSQDTGELEQEGQNTYNLERFTAFLSKWAKP